ncbi:hypothetical protein GMOD_00004709 [Pyrenophora seminiperda CCB06]|uniref:Uncharacterized protein n=1 Tax=Pyrenophora seminiperda CCB06 TaxID=1302712 RepID=A0A3M7MHA4_9PLEO|nr:hypothetical protein GMOD_00004709 [Pyrenophora seminiperda CCB06]
MARPERNMYSNKESTKVNNGLYFKQGTCSDSPSVFQVSAPPIKIDFSLMMPMPEAHVEKKPTCEQLVRKLLSPPPHAFLHGTISMQWVMGLAGMDHFEFREDDERYVLAQGTRLRTHGKALGLPAAYLEWLCGDDEEITSSEQGLCLTPEFFQGLDK